MNDRIYVKLLFVSYCTCFLPIIRKIFLFLSIEVHARSLTSDWDIKEVVMRKIKPDIEIKSSIQSYFPFNTRLNNESNRLRVKQEMYPTTNRHNNGRNDLNQRTIRRVDIEIIAYH
jgi:hypothetical protein